MRINKKTSKLDSKEPVLNLYSDHSTINDDLCITFMITKKFETAKDIDIWWNKYKEGIEESCNILEQALNSK